MASAGIADDSKKGMMLAVSWSPSYGTQWEVPDNDAERWLDFSRVATESDYFVMAFDGYTVLRAAFIEPTGKWDYSRFDEGSDRLSEPSRRYIADRREMAAVMELVYRKSTRAHPALQ